MVQLTVEDLDKRECRACGKPLRLARHKTGRYAYLCGSCKLERRRARRKKYQFEHFQKVKNDRLEVLRVLGERCYLCERPKIRLELHHRAYEADSVRPEVYKKDRTRGWIGIIKEARNHPERFALLCNSCHKSVTWIEKAPNILTRLNQLFST